MRNKELVKRRLIRRRVGKLLIESAPRALASDWSDKAQQRRAIAVAERRAEYPVRPNR